MYPGPSYKSCPGQSSAKVLWSGQAVPVCAHWMEGPSSTGSVTVDGYMVRGFNAALQVHVDFQGRNRLLFLTEIQIIQPSQPSAFWKNQIGLLNLVLVSFSAASSLEMKLFQSTIKRGVCRLTDLHKMGYFILYMKSVLIQKRLKLFHSAGNRLFSHEREDKLMWYYGYYRN